MKNIFLILFGFYCLQVKSQTCSISATVNQICSGQSSTLTFSHDLPNGSTLLWNPTPQTSNIITVTPTTTTIYSCTVTNGSNSCTSSITITVNGIPTIASTTPGSRCDAGTLLLSATSSAGVVNWYASPIGGTSLSTGNSYTPTVSSTTSFYVDATNNGCTSPRSAVTATVNPTPSIMPLSQIICSSSSFSFTPSSGSGNIVPSGTTYSWSAPSVTGISGTAAGSAATAISGTLTNTTNTAIDVVYTVTPTSGSCTGSSFNVTVTVNPKPTVLTQTSTICSAGSFTISPSNGSGNILPAGTTYSWSAPSVAGITGTTSGSMAASIIGTLTNTTNASINAVYNVTPTSGSCTGSIFNVTVSVSPKPSILGQTSTICSAGTFTVTPSNGTGGIVPNGTTYTWSAPSVSGISGTVAGITASNISGTLTNSTNTAINVDYSITPTSGSCTGSNFFATITVSPKPNIVSQASTICSAGSFNISPANGTGNIVPTGTTYTWSAPSISGISGTVAGNSSSNISGTLSNITNASIGVNYIVTPTSGSCTGNSFNATITVKPVPNISSNNQEVCSNSTFQGNWMSPNIVPLNTNYTWSVTNNTQVVGETNNATAQTFGQTLTNLTLQNQTVVYNVTPVADGCTGNPFSLNLVVKPLPVANAGQDFTKTCLANTSGNSIGSAPIPGFIYSWSPSSYLSSFNAANPVANPNSTTTYTLTVSDVLSGCSASDQVIVSVDNNYPLVNAGIDGTITCNQNTSGYTIGVTPIANISYSWSPVNGLASSNSSSTVANPNTTTTYTLNAINLSNGCPGSDQITVIIDKTPPSVNAGSDFSKTCISNVFGNSIGMSALPNINYSWSPTTGLTASNIANPIANPTATTTYELTASSSINGCTATDQVIISVNQNAPLTNAGSDFTKTCTAYQNGNAIGMVTVPGISYSWAPTQGLTNSTNSNTTANPSQTTLYTLTSTDPSNGCASSDQVLVTVNNSAPTAYAGLDATISCNQNTNGAVIGMPPVGGITYSWTPNNGLSSNQSEVIANPNVNTTYTLTATNTANGCVSSDAVSVNIDTTPPIVNAGNDIVICQGEQILLNGTSNGAQVNWTPSYLVQNPNQLSTEGNISGTTTFTLTATADNGCMAQDYVTAQISIVPSSGLNTNYEICQNETLDLIVNSGVTCSWSGIYTGIGNNVSLGGLESGLLNLNLTNNDGCAASETISVVVNPIPHPIIDGAGQVCQNSYWEKYSVPSTSNFLNWSLINGEFQSDSTSNMVFVHWDTINPSSQLNAQIIITETIASTGCQNSYSKNVLLDTTASLNPATVLSLSTNVLYTTQDYPFMNWGYESILTHIPVSVGVYSQYCNFNNLDPSNYNYWVEIGNGNGCVTKSYLNEPVYTADLENQDLNELKVFPNPTENLIHIQTNIESSFYQIQTLNGSVLKSGFGTNEFSINVNDLPSGVYFLNLDNGIRHYQTKIMKL